MLFNVTHLIEIATGFAAFYCLDLACFPVQSWNEVKWMIFTRGLPGTKKNNTLDFDLIPWTIMKPLESYLTYDLLIPHRDMELPWTFWT